MSKLKLIKNGILDENPVLRLALGTCPTLAITTTVSASIGMGIAATLVLIGSNVVISALRKLIPNEVRIPAYIVIIAGFVTIIDLIIKAFSPDLNNALGIYLPLIVVNCIILGRAEMFASKNKVLDSFIDGVGMGIGFTITLFVIGSIRELLGNGSWFGLKLPFAFTPIGFFAKTSGAFLVFGVLMALVALIIRKQGKKARLDEAANCAACGVCAPEGGETK